MTPEFFAIVKEMRESQRKWFKNHMSYDLENAKKLERRVDEIIDKEIRHDKNNVEQKKLF